MATNDFKFIEQKDVQDVAIVSTFKSTKKEVAERFAKNKVAIAGTIIFILLLLVSIVLTTLVLTKNVGFSNAGIKDYNPNNPDSGFMDLAPSVDHWFGTDSVGRDLWWRCWQAVLYSLTLATVSTTLNVLIAVLIGLSMGYFDKFDKWFSGVIKIMYAMPTIIVLILFSIIFKTNDPVKSFFVLVISLVFSGWVNASQQIRGSVKKTRNLEFITASQTLGTSRFKMFGVLFTYALPIVIVQFAIIFPRMIISESILGFLGLSIPDVATLGNLINDSRNSFLSYPYQLLFPLIMLAFTTVSIQFIGFGLEDAILEKEGR